MLDKRCSSGMQIAWVFNGHFRRTRNFFNFLVFLVFFVFSMHNQIQFPRKGESWVHGPAYKIHVA